MPTAIRHYCCQECGYLASSPYWPHECNRCHADGWQLLQSPTLAIAAFRSRLIIDGKRYGADDDSAGTPNHNMRVVCGWDPRL